jgi:hypothetical protein
MRAGACASPFTLSSVLNSLHKNLLLLLVLLLAGICRAWYIYSTWNWPAGSLS